MKNFFLLITAFFLVSTVTVYSQEQDERVFEDVDEMPRFSGCENEGDNAMRDKCAQERLLEFIYGNLTYAPEAREKGIEGRVITTFVVDTQGKVKDVKVEKGVHESLDRNAVEVIRKLNDEEPFIPGRKDGKVVNVRYTLPISYRLTKETKEKE